MTERGEDPVAALRRLVNGFQVSQAIHVAAVLGIADRIAAGVHDSAALAEATGTDPQALYRVLRALAAAGVFAEHDDRRFDLTPIGEHLRSDGQPTLAGWVSFIGRPYFWEAWGHLLDSVRTGDNAFRLTHGVSPWEYRAAHPDESVIFDRAMASVTSQVSGAVLAEYDFSRFERVVDVGGGSGAFIAALLAACPTVTGVVFDQPHVVAVPEPVLQSGELAGRCTILGGDFFDSVPAGADAYVMKAVLHDWPDAEAIEILMRCRAAGGGSSTAIVVERVLAGPNEGADGKFSDLNMLVGPGGQERSVAEFAALFAAAGYEPPRVYPTASPMTVLEAAAI